MGFSETILPDTLMKHIRLVAPLLLSLCIESVLAETAPALVLKEPLTNADFGIVDEPKPVRDVKNAMQSGTVARTLPGFPVSDSGPNRIAIQGQKIVQAIYDQTQLEVQTDETNGQIFVIPRTKTPQALFLTTDQQQTHSLTLIPQKTESQEIVIKGKTPASEKASSRTSLEGSTEVRLSALPVETADTFPQAMKNLMIAMARNEIPEGFSVNNRCGENCLRQYVSENYDAKVIRFQNKGLRPLTLSERSFYQKGVLAVAMTQPHLRIGESSTVYIIRRLVRSASADRQ